MEKKNLDWGNIGFSYVPTDMRYVADYKNGVWGEGCISLCTDKDGDRNSDGRCQ